MDPYKLLELPKNYTLEQLKSQYKKFAMQLHPDKCKSNTDYLFKTLTQAYKYLLKEFEKRKQDKPHDELRAESRKVMNENQYGDNANCNLGNGNNFNVKRFNKIFEKVKMEDPVMETGYGFWMQKSQATREDIPVQNEVGSSRNFDVVRFNQTFDKKTLSKKPSSKMIVYEEPEAMEISKKIQFSELGVSKIDDFSGDNTTCKRLQYTDYKVAHTTSRLIDPRIVQRNEHSSKNIEDLKNQRANVSHVMDQDELRKYNARIAQEQQKEQTRLRNLEDYNRRVEAHFKSVHHLLQPQNR